MYASESNMISASNIPRRRSPSPPAFSSKYHSVVVPAPRRPPPTALRLVGGPLPARSRPKHTLPSLPRPAFHPKLHVVTTGPTPRKLSKDALTLEQDAPAIHLAKERYPPLFVPGYSSEMENSGSDGETSPTYSSGSSSGPPSPVGDGYMRGPWDHSSSIRVPFDVAAILPPPRRVAINARA